MSEQVETPRREEQGEEVGGADEPAGGQPSPLEHDHDHDKDDSERKQDEQSKDSGGAAGGAMPTSAAGLAAVLDGRSDDEIIGFIKEQGYDAVLGQIFSEMQGRFLPEKTGGRSAVIQYDVNTPDGAQAYQVVVAGGTCTARKGADKEPTVTLVLSLPDFLRLISGKLNGVQAFMSGKLKIRGDMMLAQSMQGWFDQS
ncbi:MAG: SCP2 sterol-binding domain-containing protein [Candidatus Dormibacteria bacterium]